MSSKANLTIFMFLLVSLIRIGIMSAAEVRIKVNAAQVKGSISTKLTGVNASRYYDTDALWADLQPVEK